MAGLTATETIRAMLDGRGVKWHNRDSESGHDDCLVFKTWWKGNLFYEESYPNGDSYTLLEARSVEHITPEQAVEATLGRGTCHAIDTGYATAFCSVCGAEFMGSIMTNEPPDYVKPLTRCPECGRKIVEVDE